MVFSNNPNEFLKNIDKLPDVLIDIVYLYIPISVTMFLTKKEYIEKHHIVIQIIDKRKTEQYIRAMIEHDNDFVFKHLLIENYRRWIYMTKYYYKECIYGNYLNFLEAYSMDNESIKCRNLILKLFEEEGLCKNQHKKNTIRYIRWRT